MGLTPGYAQSSLSTASSQIVRRAGLLLTTADARHRVRLVTSTPNFYLEHNESLHPALAPHFEAEWSGFLLVLRTATYTFDKGDARLFLDGSEVGDQPVRVQNGWRTVRIVYRRTVSVASLQLRWKASHFSWELIPLDRWSHDATTGLTSQERLVERGRRLVEDYGCVNCHQAESRSLSARPGPDLTAIASRVSTAWLAHWIEAPHSFRPDSPMPRQLTRNQSRDVVAFLVSLAEVGDFKFQRMSNEAGPFHGRQLFATLGCAACHENPENEPAQPLTGLGSKMSVAALKAYLLNPAQFDPSERMPSLSLTDGEAYDLAALLTRSRHQSFEQTVEIGDAKRGREIIRSAGCLACHSLGSKVLPFDKSLAPKLRQLSPKKGCLADKPTGVPIYMLQEKERKALSAFITVHSARPDVSSAPLYDLPRRLSQLGCITCHKIGESDSTAALAEAAPVLTEIGAKLKPTWISSMLQGTAKTYHRRQLRMPRYEPAVEKYLVSALVKSVGLSPELTTGTAVGVSHSVEVTRGIGLLGTDASRDGMGCVGCHGFQGHNPLGEDGPDLTHVGERLRFEWFRRWMSDPARIVSGTSMPNYFTSTEQDETDLTIGGLWAALTMGENMALPAGLANGLWQKKEESLLVAEDKPIVFRWYMPEATPAAIAVGLPGGISYCFDAGESRLRYAWRGGFLDVTGTLNEKRDPETRRTRTPDIIGDIFYRAVRHPLRVGSLSRLPSARFHGYQLVEGYPEFHYEIDGIQVYERITSTEKNDGFRQEFFFARIDRPTWLLIETNDTIAVDSSIGPVVDGKLVIPMGQDIHFSVTTKVGLK